MADSELPGAVNVLLPRLTRLIKPFRDKYGGYYASVNPVNPIKASDIRPAVISDIGEPLKGAGTFAAFRRSRSDEKSTSTSEKPKAALKP